MQSCLLDAATQAAVEHLANVASLARWTDELPARARRVVAAHGDAVRWGAVLASLPDVATQPPELDRDRPWVRALDALSDYGLEAGLLDLSPWRKGPFDVCGVAIDGEWRCDVKFARLAAGVDFAGRRVLDVGCGNGYYALRMLGRGAAFVLGVDPSILFGTQFLAVQKYFRQEHAVVLPLGVADVPSDCRAFDTVVSMGVLYHRRDPLEHLRALASFAAPGADVVVESLVIEGASGEVLAPEGRYAKMRNVWVIPTCATLAMWMQQVGLRDVWCIDVSTTTPDEQRRTRWMPGESLSDFLDPRDSTRTVEGYPAPRRALFVGKA